MSTPAAARSLRFGRFELQAHERRLLRDQQVVPLGARAFDVLLALAERPGQLVSKRVLMELVWPGQVVEENNLAAQVSALRKVVGGDVVATIPGRGYRFVARLDSADAAAPVSPGAAPAPSAAAPPSLRTNLPVELPALLGRADDLATLGALIDAHRMVSIVGAGGMGKSLLAQHLLQSRRNAYAHGVCWVELAEVDHAAALPGAIAAAIGVHIAPGEPLAALLAAAAPLEMLLGLDNAEHQLGAVADVCQALHDAAPGLRLLVTSQVPLGRAVERVSRIEPLAIPEGSQTAASALQFGAVALFAQRAVAADARFEVTDANAAQVAEICRTLDGVPLAIELAAARARVLGVPQLLASMHNRLDLLTSNRNRAAPARQQTLRAALDWSYGFLQEREQRVFRRLGVVAGSASLGLIERMLAEGSNELDRWGVLDALDTLADRSLLAVIAAEGDGEPRYRLLESPRAYALERLDLAGERERMQRRHAQALAASFDAAYDEYFSGRVGVDAWLRRIEWDFDNAREALRWARASGDTPLELTIAATLLRALPQSLHEERMALAEACFPHIGAPVPEALQFRMWIELSCAWADTQKPRARDAAAHALALARKLASRPEHRFMLYHALCRFASGLAQVGDVDKARPVLAELEAVADPAWPAHRLLWGTEVAQVMARISGDAIEARRRSRQLLELDKARGGDTIIAQGNLIDAELAAGDAEAAARSGAEFVQVLQGTRDEYTLAYARLNLCAAYLARDDRERARAVAQAAWGQAFAFELQHYSAAYGALLAALEARPRTAARLLGYARAAYAARKETIETNERDAMARAEATARQALGDADFERSAKEGVKLDDREIAALALAQADR